VLNIHPSLLPKYPGLKAIERSFSANESIFGVTLHFVDEGVDTGLIFGQCRFNKLSSDTLDDVKAKCHLAEYELYRVGIDWVDQICAGSDV